MVKVKKKLETEKILDLVSQVRSSIPEKFRPDPKPRPSEDTRMPDASTEEEFEMLAVADALGTLADELNDSIQKANAKLLQDCLNVYYATAELVKDPANAHLIPHLEAMKKAYEDSYGHPIPPKKA